MDTWKLWLGMALLVFAGVMIGIAINEQASDHTMTQAEANRLAGKVTVYLCEGTTEDDVYIPDRDQGRVDLIPLRDGIYCDNNK